MAQLHELFTQLDDELKEENYDSAVKIANRILSQQPDDADAFRVKLVCFVHMEQFDQLLNTIRPHKNRSSLVFFEAYALYRLKKLNESLELLEVPNIKEKELLELKAQVYYGMERYSESSQVYETILQTYGHTTDLITNLCAALVKSNDFDKCNKLINKYQQFLKETFEYPYNAACSYIESGDYTTAEKYLELSQSICQTSLSKEGFSKEEIEDETAIIRTQLAYTLQKKGNKETAVQIYTQISEQKIISDQSVTAVIDNNLITLHDGDRLESLKKFNKLRQDKTQVKLLLTQKQTLGFNHGLLLQQMNKNDECRELIQKLQKEYPTNDLLPLLNVSVLMKERKIQKAQALLEEFAANHPQSSVRTRLSIAQIHLTQGNIPALIQTLESIDTLRNSPAMICTLVALYQKIKKINEAINVLDLAVKTVSKEAEYYPLILKKNADFKLSCGRYKEAAAIYEQLLKLNPNDLEAIPSLVIAYSYFNPEKARKHESSLPDLESEVAFDPEQLANLSIPTVKRKENRKKELDTSTEKPKDKPKSKKPKKRKNKPPKNIDPNKPIDPERWLPKSQRSNYKGKRKGKGKDRGAQGAISASQAVKAQKGPLQSEESLTEEGQIHVSDEDVQDIQGTPGRRGKPAAGSKIQNRAATSPVKAAAKGPIPAPTKVTPAPVPAKSNTPALNNSAAPVPAKGVTSAPAPAPANNATPAPAPAPAKNATPAPANNATPAPAKNATPALANSATSAPVKNTTPAPAKGATQAPAQAKSTTPAQAKGATQSPAKGATPAQAAKNTPPAQAKSGTPAPAKSSSPQAPAKSTAPAPAKGATPAPVPEKSATLADSTAPAPEKSGTPAAAPEPSTVPEPATEPATVSVPVKGTTPAPATAKGATTAQTRGATPAQAKGNTPAPAKGATQAPTKGATPANAKNAAPPKNTAPAPAKGGGTTPRSKKQ